ncbi:TadE/TadG family type IV pilus assembly protein [Yoonia sediminilitoris]|uniref:Putative Flp pilus-assembly TadE/G-like protein n=1 Tax=Yoonia sediminilitoris TaxID=1286148 RepID=A0A2T6KLX3_9RHOB|nr:pilus assembly protein TadG-related protein [Yoonia sediminilitoris]PUB17212.1 putative Flp pilus-assembly TadE/G-like protein [Yoonia sediminilitoris]RCW97507.1 putative Flp pilus-assembly TadE/G-like protein [Yoonia sediminilitoris]
MGFDTLAKIRAPLSRFHRDESGSVSAFGLVMFVGFAAVGAIGLDVSSVYAARTHLQIAADQAAHAALYNRSNMDPVSSKQLAIDLVNKTLPTEKYGKALRIENIKFGSYDSASGSFTVDDDSTTAVRVRTSFLSENQNPVATYLFKLVGYSSFDVSTDAIYTTYRPGCLREGFIAQGMVDIQSNNSFTQGFCIHSNTLVSLNSNNTFEAGTIVSMPDLDALDLPKSGFETNEGLEAALRAATMNIRILSRIDNMIYRYENPEATDYPADTEELPDYITNPTVISSRVRTITTAEIYALESDTGRGRVHKIDCQAGNTLTIDATEPLREVVVISPCEIKFTAGSVLEDSRVISKSTSADSINAPAGLRVGRNDNCGDGGGAQLITVGGMRFPADLQIYGSQLMAKGDIYFAANADGVQGASLIAGGEISGTSNMNMGLCLGGMEDNIEIDYFRLAY